jgi:hypothetical protein
MGMRGVRCPSSSTVLPGVWEMPHVRRDAATRLPLTTDAMKGKRAQPESTNPFESRKHAADILRGDIDIPGSYIEGRIFSLNPRNNQYTVDIRLDSKAKATHLDVFIEKKLQKRLELLVGDHLQISLQGAQLLPHTGAPSHLPFVLRFREGITVLLVSRAGPQDEKEKLFDIWPGHSEHYHTSV